MEQISLEINEQTKTLYMHRSSNGRIGIGFTEYHRSCLVLRIDNDTLYIDGLSTRRRRDQILKNPLGLPRQSKHMHIWLQIAEAFARYHNLIRIKLFDAANIVVDSRYIFLSSLLLLRDNQFLYEKYGYFATECEEIKVFLKNQSPNATKVQNIYLQNVLRRSSTWREVYDRLVRQRRQYLAEDLLESFGYFMPKLQYWYTKNVEETSVVITEIKQIPKVPWYHSERWLDVD